MGNQKLKIQTIGYSQNVIKNCWYGILNDNSQSRQLIKSKLVHNLCTFNQTKKILSHRAAQKLQLTNHGLS